MPQYYEFEVALQELQPRIWRRFLLPTRATFAQLNTAIQESFGWTNSHLWEFRRPTFQGRPIAGLVTGEEEADRPVPDALQVKLSEYFTGERVNASCEFIYDFGDDWVHDVKLIRVVTEEATFRRRLLDGQRACPPEDCGGAGGYERVVTFVRIGEDVWDDAEGLAMWLGDWDPDRFDLEAAQKAFEPTPPKRARRDPPRPATTNAYCDPLQLAVPSLEAVKDHREAKTYSLLIVALLERGAPMALVEVAERFEDAGVMWAQDALRSLHRCRPARAPVYRDGDLYALDPHDGGLDLWAFRLGLRPPKAPKIELVRPEPPPLPGPQVPLTTAEIEEAFQDAWFGSNWSAQRLAISVLDASGGRLPAAQVVATMDRLAKQHLLREASAQYWGKGSPISATDGVWELDASHAALSSAREAVRKRIESERRHRASRPDPSVTAANIKRSKERRAAHAAELAQLRRALLYVYPDKDPEAAVLVDVNDRELKTYLRPELDALRARLARYEVIGAINVRAVLRALDHDPGTRRLAELAPPQKTRTLNKAGRKLKITLALLVQGSCNISRPFAEPKRLQGYLDKGELTKFRRRIEADAKSLFAIYQYGRLHGAVRLRWGFLDEHIPAPWHHKDEPTLYALIREAHQQGRVIEAVTGSAPGWADPWSKVRACTVEKLGEWSYTMFDERGMAVDEQEVQAARLAPR
jgi:Plasmid pRiA4b ORF-3-like protein